MLLGKALLTFFIFLSWGSGIIHELYSDVLGTVECEYSDKQNRTRAYGSVSLNVSAGNVNLTLGKDGYLP